MASTFRDRNGKEWSLDLNGGSASLIDRADISSVYDKPFSMLQPEQDFIVDVATNGGLVLALIWLLCKDQRRQLDGVDHDQPSDRYDEECELAFLSSLGGVEIEAAKNAFWDEMSSFFPQAATVLSAFREATKKFATDAAMKIGDLMQTEYREAQAKLDDALSNIRGGHSSNASPSLV